MTMPYERTSAVLQTREFLKKLAYSQSTDIPQEIASEAHRLLRHYPEEADMRITSLALAQFWEMPTR